MGYRVSATGRSRSPLGEPGQPTQGGTCQTSSLALLLTKGPVCFIHGCGVAVIVDAIQQGDDPIRVHALSGGFLPQPFTYQAVTSHELGFGELAGQREHQLPFLELSKAPFELGGKTTGPHHTPRFSPHL